MAAEMAGISFTRLKAVMANDEDFASEIEDAMAYFADLLKMTALDRATNGKSDTLLVKMLEANVEGYSKETRATTNDKRKPSGLRLRMFDNEGNEIEDAKPASKPADSKGPLLLEMYQGL